MKKAFTTIAVLCLLLACNDSDFDLGADVRIFPNPFPFFFQAELQMQQDANVTINLHSAVLKAQAVGGTPNRDGNPLFEGPLTAGPHQLQFDVSDFEKGVYFLDIIVNDKVQRFEIVKTGEI